MAGTEQGGTRVVDVARSDAARLGDDDIVVLPGEKHRELSRRKRALVAGGVTIVVGMIVAVIIVLLGANSSSTRNVKIHDDASKPSLAHASSPPTHPRSASPATLKPGADPSTPASPNRVAGGVPATAVGNGDTSPVTDPTAGAPAEVQGPSVLRWLVTPGPTVTIPTGGTAMIGVMVTNPTARPAYLPTPLDCLATPKDVCPAHAERVASHKSRLRSFTLRASDFGATPTKVYIGGYYAVTVTVL